MLLNLAKKAFKLFSEDPTKLHKCLAIWNYFFNNTNKERIKKLFNRNKKLITKPLDFASQNNHAEFIVELFDCAFRNNNEELMAALYKTYYASPASQPAILYALWLYRSGYDSNCLTPFCQTLGLSPDEKNRKINSLIQMLYDRLKCKKIEDLKNLYENIYKKIKNIKKEKENTPSMSENCHYLLYEKTPDAYLAQLFAPLVYHAFKVGDPDTACWIVEQFSHLKGDRDASTEVLRNFKKSKVYYQVCQLDSLFTGQDYTKSEYYNLYGNAGQGLSEERDT